MVHAEVRVLSAGVSGCPAAPARARSVPWSRHLLEARRQQLQQSGLEDSLRSRCDRTRPHLAAHLISAVGLSAALRPRCDLELESDVLCVLSHTSQTRPVQIKRIETGSTFTAHCVLVLFDTSVWSKYCANVTLKKSSVLKLNTICFAKKNKRNVI